MGISVSAGTAVILVGMFLMLGVIVPGTLNAHDRITSATEDRDRLAMERAHTSVTIEDVEPVEDGLRVNVTNDGTSDLALSDTDVLVDNALAPSEHTSVAGDNGTDLWLPDETAELTVSTTGNESLVVATSHGVRDRSSLEGI